MTTTVVNNSLFRSLFEKQKLTGNNFLEWYRNLRIVLSTEDKLPFLEQPIPVLLVPPQGQANPPDVVTTHQAWVKAHKEIVGLMLMTMDLDIQKNLEHLGAYDMLKELKKFYIENLEHLGHAMTQNLSVSLILVSLRKEYDSFVQNYNMHSMGKTKNQKKKSYKAAKGNQGKGKAKIGYAPVQAPPFAPKPKNPPTPKKDNPAKDVICHQCGKVGHWRRNCPIYLSELMKKKKLSHGASTSGDLGEPANYKAALLDPESKKWLNAMNVEMQPMKDNEVWELVDLPSDGKTVGHKWLFKKKTHMDGAVHTYKARLVAKGFTQTSRIDYEETFSPVADIRAIKILIAIAAFYDYKIWKMNVKTAFINGYLSEEVYMEQLEGFVNQKFPNQVCKLKHSIYGLKQASRQWNKRFYDEIKKFGFREAAYILGIKIYRDRSKRLIGLCQSAYIEKILKRFYMENSKRGTIPMQEKLKLSKSQGASTPAEIHRMQNIPYASAFGSIMYAVRCTRPDVAFAQNITSRFQQNPGDVHWTTVKNILKYLRNTKDMFLVYGGVVDWKSTKQSIFATSSTDAEYIAAFDASKEAVWIRKFISGLDVVPTIEEPINMYCDNTGAIAIAKDHGITK
ncbi:retrotransposon protein, putative, ty1-copia subclass, partial [Tanacetum coccineum]